MKLHLKPEEIKRLTRKMLYIIANCEIRSQQNGAEAEVFYVCKTPEKRIGRYAHYYAIIEKTEKSGYVAKLWLDDTLQNASICTANNIEEMRNKLPKEIERLRNINVEIKRDIVDRDPRSLHI